MAGSTIINNFIEILAVCFLLYFSGTATAKKLWLNEHIRRIFTIVVLTVCAGYFVYALIGIPTQTGGALLFHSFDYALLNRVGLVPNTGHTLVWLAILGAFFYVYWLERKSAYGTGILKAMLTTFGFIALSEFYWNMFYFAEINLNGTFIPDTLGGFVLSQMFLGLVIAVWATFYRKDLFFLRLCLFILPVESVFFVYWFLIGMPVTISAGTYIFTQWYSNLFVNGLEILSWYVISVTTALAYYQVKKWIEFRKNRAKVSIGLPERYV